MGSSSLLAVTAHMWFAIAVMVVLYLLVAGPILAVSLYAVWERSLDAVDHVGGDVARFIELREQARSELATTGSIDRFIELMDRARKERWTTAADRATRRSATALPTAAAATAVSQPDAPSRPARCWRPAESRDHSRVGVAAPIQERGRRRDG
jgi:hypothetical protein